MSLYSDTFAFKMFFGIIGPLGGFSWSFQLYIHAFQPTPTPHTFTLKFLKLFVVAPWMPLAAALPWREAAVTYGGWLAQRCLIWRLNIGFDSANLGYFSGPNFYFGIYLERKQTSSSHYHFWGGRKFLYVEDGMDVITISQSTIPCYSHRSKIHVASFWCPEPNELFTIQRHHGTRYIQTNVRTYEGHVDFSLQSIAVVCSMLVNGNEGA